MSEEQLSNLLAKLKQDAGLLEKLKGAENLDAAVTLVKEAGFDVSKADWLNHQAKRTLDLNDQQLERVAGAKGQQSEESVTCDDAPAMACELWGW
jgi:predicted ribosomally synthesized peptide with nif11-like leader